jgi:hypothetical protein
MEDNTKTKLITELITELDVELPNNFQNYDQETQELIVKYIHQLDRIEKMAYTIGKQHLGTSFNVVKSNGFINWKQKQIT